MLSRRFDLSGEDEARRLASIDMSRAATRQSADAARPGVAV